MKLNKHDLNSIQELSDKKHNNNFLVLKNQLYVNNKNKLKFYCKKCNNIIDQRVDNHLNGASCPVCERNNRFLNLDQVRKKVYDILVDKYIIPDQEIVGVKNKIKVFCKKCDKYFQIRLNTLLEGKGCVDCGYDKMRLSLNEIRERSEKI